MERLINQAFDALRTLPLEDQERLAWEIIQRVEDKTEWDTIIAQPQSQLWLEKESARAIKVYAKVKKNLSQTFVSIPQENMLRDAPYWTHFDELPEDIKKLAQSNYRLWKENPGHPGLRFKQIHATRPVFSFRVGMKNRTVGVEVAEGKIAWFWVGSFSNFKALIND